MTTLILNKPVETHVKVQFADTDCMNVVWHGAYLRFLEISRTDYFQEYTDLQDKLIQSQLILTMKSINVQYLYPARLYDDLIIKTWMSNINKLKMDMKHEIYLNMKKLLLADVEIVCMHKEGYIQRMPLWLTNLK